MIEIKDLTKKYKDYTVLENISLTLPNHGLFFIVGKSGSGKSTLLHLIAGLDQEYSGVIQIHNQNLKDISLHQYLKNEVAFIFQDNNLIDEWTVAQNMTVSCKEQSNISIILKKLKIDHLVNKKVKYLSGGQKQRVAIGRALAKDFKILLCDEPTGSLDWNMGIEVFHILKEIAKERLVIFVTHSNKLIKMENDGIINIHNKQLQFSQNIEIQSPAELVVTNEKPRLLNTLAHISLRNMWHNKKRSLLSIFGISIGITGIILSLGLSKGMKHLIQSEINMIFSPNAISVMKHDESYFTYNQLQSLKNEKIINHHFNIVDLYYHELELVSDTTKKIYINDFTKILDKDILLLYGRHPISDYEMVLPKSTAISFIGNEELIESLINQDVSIQYEFLGKEKTVIYKIVGVIDEMALFDIAYLVEDAQVHMLNSIFSIDKNEVRADILSLYVKKDMETKTVFNELINQFPDYNFKMISESLETEMNDLLSKVTTIILFFSIFIIICSFLLTMIVIYLSVIEKEKQFAILKSLGYSNNEIKEIVILESFFLGIFSCAFSIIQSVLLSIVVLNVIQSFLNKPISLSQLFQLPIFVYLIIILFCFILSPLVGLIPATKTVKYDIIKNLKK